MPLLYGKCNDYLIKAIECMKIHHNLISFTAYPLPI